MYLAPHNKVSYLIVTENKVGFFRMGKHETQNSERHPPKYQPIEQSNILYALVIYPRDHIDYITYITIEGYTIHKC